MTKAQTDIAVHNERINQLEGNYKELTVKVDTILTKNLPGIERSIASLSTKINVMTAINVGAMILAVLANKYL